MSDDTKIPALPAGTTVEHVPGDGRGSFELRRDGRVIGAADYVRSGERWLFTHTEVEPALSGGGLGTALVGAAFDEVRAAGGRAVPRCSFVRQFVADHPQVQDLVDDVR